jgi:hypothetical protein
VQKLSENISIGKNVQILAASKNQADCKILAAAENQADGKILAARENQADDRILAGVEIPVPGEKPCLWKYWRDWKSRRPAYCLGSAESPTADFSLVPLMRTLSSVILLIDVMNLACSLQVRNGLLVPSSPPAQAVDAQAASGYIPSDTLSTCFPVSLFPSPSSSVSRQAGRGLIKIFALLVQNMHATPIRFCSTLNMKTKVEDKISSTIRDPLNSSRPVKSYNLYRPI